MYYECKKCGESYSLDVEMEPTTFCNTCAQDIIERLVEIVPEPTKAITWERGVEILNVLQKEIYGTN